ncbi:N-acetylmuramoyl-L-alanine amidase-like domain-containing protein [Burkholderia pyrrocinia]|uniref:N-acetylmuramoyl-L-alanine amidase-like domain-containing protein n=1 Tax=Burkholderia pyrrocinia TaxID=60550 RepID=UPI0020C61EA3|nr:N-acetylmuramoyl-L-alanine amidase-like domain-containing protein [Burkholderia pyrrocinia]
MSKKPSASSLCLLALLSISFSIHPALASDKLRTGDLIGIYAKADGLDVTHVGFFVETNDGPMLRNASSEKANMKVVDSPFVEYVKNTPGIVVLRLRA